MYNFNHLYYFYLIVKLEGVTKAASYLKTSQSSLSTQMKQFEGGLGKKLFIRDGRKLTLTSDGQTIYSFCKSSFEIFEEMKSYLNNKNNIGRRKLRIGVCDEIERPFISSLVSNIIKKDVKKKSSVSLHSSDHKRIMELFLTRDIDFAITSDPILVSGIKYSASIDLTVGVVVSSRHYKSLGANILLKNFLDASEVGLALPSSSLKLRKEIDTFLTKNNIARDVVFESNVISALVRSVLDGAVVSFLPLVYVEKELKQGRVLSVSIKNKLWSHRIFLYSYSVEFLNEICNEIGNQFFVKVNKDSHSSYKK